MIRDYHSIDTSRDRRRVCLRLIMGMEEVVYGDIFANKYTMQILREVTPLVVYSRERIAPST